MDEHSLRLVELFLLLHGLNSKSQAINQWAQSHPEPEASSFVA